VGYGVGVWSSPEWQAQAVAWLDERLAASGIRRTGEATHPHVRPWATVVRAPTDAGVVWMKAPGPGTAFEVGLYELLQRAAPEHVLTPIAVDTGRAWMVLPDGGEPLGERLDGEDLAEAMAEAMAQYAEMQLRMAPHADALVGLGVSDMRPAVMPARFEEALTVVGDYVARRGDPAERERYEAVAGMGDAVAGWCERLAAAPGAASIDHNDLHPWNVLTPDTGGPARFFDWGDAVVAHPFASMLVPMEMLADVRVRDAYLEPFAHLASRAELLEALTLARRVAKVARALTWERALRHVPPEDISEEWADGPYVNLVALLDDES
jgi:hypothetical protein